MAKKGRPRRQSYDPGYRGYYDPDPALISIGTIIGIIIIGGVISGTSIAIQNPTFFDRIISMLNPKYAQMAEEDRKKEQEFWRIVLIIVLVVCAVIALYVISKWTKGRRRR